MPQIQQDKHSNRSTTKARSDQRQRHAEHAKRKVQQRREKQ
jgi:hypothetical protein